MLKTIQNKGDYAIYNTQLIDDVSGCFDPVYWQQHNKVIGSAQGRGTTWFVQLDNMQAALRHYRRGGLFGKVVSDVYWFTGFQKTRCVQEFHLLNYLQEQGVHVPKPIAAKVTRHNLVYRADLLSEKIPNATDLVDLLTTQALPQSVYHSIGKEIKKLHQAQVNHTDLNIHNILVDENRKVWIIDFDKCAQQGGEQWKTANLDRLLRSFHKEVVKRAIHWTELDWQYLLEGYK